ncbi:MAG: GNAT family N-acetyltransferase [Streptosporangiaceae bacterium]|jgi:RimJ/RimL family protein N-acetyltransferase|nr:hypothetical protein [Actinomycetota bacterium]
MESLTPPEEVLTDGLVTLRLPSVTDADALVGYAAGQDGGLGGAWLPALKAGASREHCLWMIDDWLAGWSGGGSYNGPALVLESGQSPAPVGLVGFVPRDAGTIGLVFGVAPSWRGRGLATRAVVLAADWLIRERGAAIVELRIAPDSPACQRVAAKAGFRAAGTVSGVIEATGQEVENLRYIAAASKLTAYPRAAG